MISHDTDLDQNMDEYRANPISDIASPATSVLPSEILIVDDTVENLRLLSNMLSIQGYSVRKATGGEMAIQSVESLPPDLILLDILMPDLNGYEVCTQIKRNPQTANIPIIFLSALDDPLDKVKAFEVGGVDYLTKPFQLEEVLARVHNQLSLKDAQEKVVALNAKLQEWLVDQNQKLHLANSRILETSSIDSLTGIPNRASLLTRLEQSLFLAKMDEAYKFALLYLDCDRFSTINQSFGYQAGDELLQELAKRLQAIIRPDDMLARIGGDQFAILLNKPSDPNQVHQFAQEILVKLQQPFPIQGQEIALNVSIGTEFSGAHFEKPGQIFGHAETAMYRSKAAGGNQSTSFTTP